MRLVIFIAAAAALVALVLILSSGHSLQPQPPAPATRKPAASKIPNYGATSEAQNVQATQTAEARWVNGFCKPILEEANRHPPNFSDDFSDRNGRFVRWSSIDAGVTFPEGVMRINTTGADWSGAGGSLNAADFVLKFDFTPRQISNESGIVANFRGSAAGWYNFGFNLYDEWWGMGYLPNGEYQTVREGFSKEVRLNRTTRVIVMARGNEFAFYTNGRPFAHVKHNALQGGNDVSLGVYAPGESAEVDIDNVEFWDLNKLVP